jgi:Uma2 family endonuclease
MSTLAPRRWTVDEFERAATAGVFSPDERLELIDGQIVPKMSPQAHPHALCIVLLSNWLETVAKGERHVRTQSPVKIGLLNKPEPDAMVLRGTARSYRSLPTAIDALLVVEVSDTSLAVDRGPKAALYASGGIPEYWVLDLTKRRLYVMREPQDGEYRNIRTLSESETVASLFAPGSR